MANQKNFAITPSVSISRSKFKRPSQHKTSFNLGQLVPIYVDADILPGDTVSMDLAALIRMSNPIAPIMDNIYVDYYAFFVPNRLVWDDWKKFMGENTSSFGAVSEPTFPDDEIGTANRITVGCLGDYMGLPITASNSYSVKVSCLPGRAYFLIYNEWFRDQNIIAPISVATGNGGYHLGNDPSAGGASLNYSSALRTVAKESDYFTRALPYAQKGSPVSLPLGSTAPVGFIAQSTEAGSTVNYRAGTGTGYSVLSGFNQMYRVNTSDVIQGSNDYRKIVADLSGATAATINQLRFAFQYQKFLEKDAQPFYRASINRAISVNA